MPSSGPCAWRRMGSAEDDEGSTTEAATRPGKVTAQLQSGTEIKEEMK
jgi:hypothetical protein